MAGTGDNFPAVPPLGTSPIPPLEGGMGTSPIPPLNFSLEVNVTAYSVHDDAYFFYQVNNQVYQVNNVDR